VNVIIEGSKIEPGDADLLFGDGRSTELYQTIAAQDLPQLLVKLGIYATTSDARRAGRTGPIPPGFTLMKASKQVRVLAIWNPTESLKESDERRRRES
jgi:hypothetical protein